jgi:nitrogen fixation protein NifU and related proteins
MYSDQVLDHFQNPRHVGDLEDATVSVETQNPACGDVLRLSLRIENGHITAARFRAKGCVPSIACGSKLAELLEGSRCEVAAVTREQLMRELGGLPPASEHASHLAMDALNLALSQAANKSVASRRSKSRRDDR